MRSAKLRVYAYSGTVDGPAVYTTNPAWTETAVNWNNRPPRTSATTDDKGAIATNSWVEYDVTLLRDGQRHVQLRPRRHLQRRRRLLLARGRHRLRPELVVTTGAPDTQKPTPPPSGLGATVVSASQVDLSWQAAGDNVGVTGYRVFRNGTQIASLGVTTAYSDTTVAAEQLVQLRGARGRRRRQRLGPEQLRAGNDTAGRDGADALARGGRPCPGGEPDHQLRDRLPARERRHRAGRRDLPALRRDRRPGRERAERQAAPLQLQRHRGRPGCLHDRHNVERDHGQLEHATGPHERYRDGRQGRDSGQHAGSSTT